MQLYRLRSNMLNKNWDVFRRSRAQQKFGISNFKVLIAVSIWNLGSYYFRMSLYHAFSFLVIRSDLTFRLIFASNFMTHSNNRYSILIYIQFLINQNSLHLYSTSSSKETTRIGKCQDWSPPPIFMPRVFKMFEIWSGCRVFYIWCTSEVNKTCVT